MPGAQSAARFAQVDGDSDFLQSDVGGAELAVVVVASLAESLGHLLGPLKLVISGIGIADTGSDNGTLQGQPAP